MKKFWIAAVSVLFLIPMSLAAENHIVSLFGGLSIQGAVDAAQPGDTVIIEEGIYEIEESIRFSDKSGITFQGQGEVWILCSDLYTDVFSIVNCEDLNFYTIKARHKEFVPEYTCNGSVFSIANSSRIEILDCEFSGSGAIGVYLEYSDNINVSYSYIHHNSFSAFYLSSSTDVVISYNRIVDNAMFMTSYDTGSVEMYGNIIAGNDYSY